MVGLVALGPPYNVNRYVFQEYDSVAKKRTAKQIAKIKPVRQPALARTWKQHLQELKAFKREHGHCHVPQHYPPNPELGGWVGRARVRYKRGELTRNKSAPWTCSASSGCRWQSGRTVSANWRRSGKSMATATCRCGICRSGNWAGG